MAAVVLGAQLLSMRSAFAESSLLKNIELCNDLGRRSPKNQIQGCTALIASGAPTSLGMAISYNNRGNAYSVEQKYDLAIADYDRALMLNPRYVKAYNNRGVAYEKKGDLDRALENFNAAIALDGRYAYAFINRGDVYVKKHDLAAAGHDYETAVRLKDTIAKAWSGRCWVEAQSDDLGEALKDCSRALTIEPTAEAYDTRAFIYLKAGEWESAVSDYDNALKLNASLASSLYGRGLAKLRKGNKAGSEQDIAAAIKIHPSIESEFRVLDLK